MTAKRGSPRHIPLSPAPHPGEGPGRGGYETASRQFPRLTSETFNGSPIETEYKKLCPTPNELPKFVKRVIAQFRSTMVRP